MSTDLITVSRCDSVYKVGQIFRNKNIHHLPVIDEGELVGIISRSDFLPYQRGKNITMKKKKNYKKRLNRIPASQIMTPGMATLEPTDRINVALELFKENLFHAIPIVKKKKIKGIVTTFDIIAELSKSGYAESKYDTL